MTDYEYHNLLKVDLVMSAVSWTGTFTIDSDIVGSKAKVRYYLVNN